MLYEIVHWKLIICHCRIHLMFYYFWGVKILLNISEIFAFPGFHKIFYRNIVWSRHQQFLMGHFIFRIISTCIKFEQFICAFYGSDHICFKRGKEKSVENQIRTIINISTLKLKSYIFIGFKESSMHYCLCISIYTSKWFVVHLMWVKHVYWTDGLNIMYVILNSCFFMVENWYTINEYCMALHKINNNKGKWRQEIHGDFWISILALVFNLT